MIDFQRESKAKAKGPVAELLHTHSEARLQISPIAWGEFLAGFEDEAHPFVAFARDRLDLVPLEPSVGSVYREKFRFLEASGNLIGASDFWIGCHALSREVPLVTRDSSDFHRIPGLKVISY